MIAMPIDFPPSSRNLNKEEEIPSEFLINLHFHLFRTYFRTPSPNDFCIKLQSEGVELASFILNLLIYDILCLLGVSVGRKQENLLILVERRAKKTNF